MADDKVGAHGDNRQLVATLDAGLSSQPKLKSRSAQQGARIYRIACEDMAPWTNQALGVCASFMSCPST